MNDMTSWTRLLWDQLLYIGKHGSEGCTRSSNPMKIQCIGRQQTVKQDTQSSPTMIHKKARKNFLLDLFNLDAGELASFAQVRLVLKICTNGSCDFHTLVLQAGRDSNGHMNIKVDSESLFKKMSDQPFAKYVEEHTFVSLEEGGAVAKSRQPDWSFPSADDTDSFTAFARIGQTVLAQHVDTDNIGDLIISGRE